MNCELEGFSIVPTPSYFSSRLMELRMEQRRDISGKAMVYFAGFERSSAEQFRRLGLISELEIPSELKEFKGRINPEMFRREGGYRVLATIQ